MIAVIWLIVVLFIGIKGVQLLVFIPLGVLSNFSLPTWLTLSALTLVIFWCFGEEK